MAVVGENFGQEGVLLENWRKFVEKLRVTELGVLALKLGKLAVEKLHHSGKLATLADLWLNLADFLVSRSCARKP